MTVSVPSVPAGTVRNSSFSRSITLLQTAWDNTSMSLFKECPRKYYYVIICGYVPRGSNVHLAFGILYHEALERYDRLRARGFSHSDAVVSTVWQALKDTWNKDLNRPLDWGDKQKNRYTLIRTIVWYLEQFKDDPLETACRSDGTPFVEVSFRFTTDYVAADNTNFIICGHMDKIGILGGLYWILDRKTSKNSIDGDGFFGHYSPHNQMATYDYAGQVVSKIQTSGLIIDAAQIMVNFSHFRRGFSQRTASQRAEWYGNLEGYFYLINKYAHDGYYPMNEASCGNYGGCPFRGVCGKPPEDREVWLQAAFHKRVWDPLVVRGDV